MNLRWGKILVVFLLFIVARTSVFAGNPPDQQKSSITGAATVANGTSWSSVTIVLRDAAGNNLTSPDWIAITSTSSNTTFDPSTTTLDGSGTLYTKMRSTTTGNVSVVVTDNTTHTQITGSVYFYAPGTNPPAPGDCTDTVPGSAPGLTSAVSSGNNSVTLTWTAAVAPVTYYAISYGTAGGSYQYGNPNVGGSGTLSYTVGSLATGTTYYFVVRAGNGCAVGPASNELSAVAGSLPTETPTPMPQLIMTQTPTVTPTATPKPTSKVTPITPTPTPIPPLLGNTPAPSPVPSVAPAAVEASQVSNTALLATLAGVIIVVGVAAWLAILSVRSRPKPPIIQY